MTNGGFVTRVIGISSGKGGVGKTTVTANLALALENLGKSVLMIDCNMSTPHLSYYLGVNNYRHTLNDVMSGRVSENTAMYNYDGVRFIPASLNLSDLVGLDLRKFKKSISKIEKTEKFDYILLDSAPGLGKEAICVMNAADEVLFVTTPFVPMMNDVMRSVSVLKEMGRKRVGVVLNMTSGKGYELVDKTVESVLNLPIVGEIPFDRNMNRSLVMGTPILQYNPLSPASIGFMELAANLSGEKYSPPSRLDIFTNNIKNRLFEVTNERIKMTQTKEFVEKEMILQEGQNIAEKLRKLV